MEQHGNTLGLHICRMGDSAKYCFKRLADSTGASRCLILHPDSSGEFAITGDCHTDRTAGLRGAHLSKSDLPLVATALLRKETLTLSVNAEEADRDCLVQALALPTTADVVAVPLLLEGALAMLLVFENGVWDERSLAMVQSLAETSILRSEIKALKDEAEQRANESELILDAVNALHSARSFEATMQHIMEAISHVTGVPNCSVYVLDPSRTWLLPRFKRTVGVPTQHGSFWKIKLDVESFGLVRDIIHSKEPVFIYDAEIDPRSNKDIVAIFHNRSILGLPLVTRGEVIGVVFNGTFDEPYAFTEEQIHLCFRLASSATAAIINRRLFRESEFRNEQLAALHHISLGITSQLSLRELLESVVESAANLLRAKAGAVALFDEASDLLRFVARYNAPPILDTLSIRSGEGFTGLAARDGKALIINDYKSFPQAILSELDLGMNAVLAAPLKWQERVIGVIDVFDNADTRLFGDHDLDLLERFAAQAAVAIQNARFVQDAARVEAAREAARLKSEFLSMISHELRSPIGLIRGYASALNRTDLFLTEEQRSSFLRQLDEAASVLSTLTRDLLDTTRIESGQFLPKKTVFDLSASVSRMVDRFLTDKGGLWRFSKDLVSPLLVEADPTQIDRVIANLLDNATKYSESGTEICARVREEDGRRVVVEVEDEGAGISAEDLDHIFEKFYQGKGPHQGRPEGSGLGLYICQQLIQANGGDIQVRSKSGKGSVFSFSIPLGGVK